ncbi:MAG: hypothetical protein ACRDJL_09795 [Actinomycetota bacterium]
MSFRLWTLIAVALLVAAACGNDSTEGAAAAGAEGPTLTITSPSDGDEVSLPITVEVSTSEELGPEETGLHHWHLFVDGEELEYTVEASNEAMIEDLSPGEHTINASLQHADHSAAGASDEIAVIVTEGAAGEEGSEDGSESVPGIDY